MSSKRNATAKSSNYTLVILTLLSALAFMDRQVLSVVIQPVKLEFNLTDLQIGLVTGLGFALTFGLLGVPLGRLADKHNRRSLIAYARGLGGLLGLMGSLSVGFFSLMFTRSGGAISDAGGTPSFDVDAGRSLSS
jgi:MFS family permease